ncbi:TIGR03503 family protein [Colwellia sp. 1_MG-2023]|uniref:TIGR03503 family protein n=1 Tax=Colwellia sp. 1_MG-2023 TaxID=3062649 RepID=UPI0026E41A73|nr:TIGR03503 family protein [Colwellia sp. 1_MG-2023]MDO6447589.1 TIGR03503 family protein [Colwellia sp. 1_MG-2023]
MEKLSWLKIWALVVIIFLPADLTAQDQMPDVKYYEQDDITNQIPYFDNRFHIDAQLDEITLLFYRKNGSPPIILVRPDGSKLKVNNFPKDKVEWYDDRTFDLITIKQPMPGPWQAIGDILPNSKIMLVSEVTLKVDPIPEIALSGETLKIKGQIFNREQVVDDPLFDDVVKLDVDFFSTNNTSYDNFGAQPIQIGSFRDDGYDLDEYAKDGIFTAEFNLDFSPGEWLPIYKVIMPMATRELRQKPIILQANPVTITVETTTDPLEFHIVTLNLDDTFIDPDSMVFQGKITFPDKQTEPFAIMQGSGITRVKQVGYTEPGIHRISLNAFGETINGREFRLVVPDFSFNVDRLNGPLVPTLEDDAISQAEQAAEALAAKIAEDKAQLEMEIAQAKAEQEAAQQQTLIIIGISNLVIMLIAAGVFVFIRKKKQ